MARAAATLARPWRRRWCRRRPLRPTVQPPSLPSFPHPRRPGPRLPRLLHPPGRAVAGAEPAPHRAARQAAEDRGEGAEAGAGAGAGRLRREGGPQSWACCSGPAAGPAAWPAAGSMLLAPAAALPHTCVWSGPLRLAAAGLAHARPAAPAPRAPPSPIPPPLLGGQVRERDWSNVITAHEGDTRAYVWRLQKYTLGEWVSAALLCHGLPPCRMVCCKAGADAWLPGCMLAPHVRRQPEGVSLVWQQGCRCASHPRPGFPLVTLPNPRLPACNLPALQLQMLFPPGKELAGAKESQVTAVCLRCGEWGQRGALAFPVGGARRALWTPRARPAAPAALAGQSCQRTAACRQPDQRLVPCPDLRPPRLPPACARSRCGNFGFVGSEAGRVDRYNMQSGMHRGSYCRDPKVRPE